MLMDYIIYFIVTVGILVFVHEFGHFAAAKLSKMRVDIFAIGFGKRLFGWNKLTGFTFGDLAKDFDGQGNTDYRLCLLPLGGYVKIAGMVDESFDTKFADAEPKPYEFRAKRTLPKLFVISAGVLMNLLLTIVVFWGINFFQGKQIFRTTTISSVEQGSVADKAGFKSLDKIISVDDKDVGDWEALIDNMLIENAAKDPVIKLERNGTVETITPSKKLLTDAYQKGTLFLPYPAKSVIVEVMKNSPAEDAHLKKGDIILSVNNIQISKQELLNEIISSNKEKNIPMVLLRGKDTVKTNVNPGVEGKIGIVHQYAYAGKVEYRTYGLFGSMTQAVVNAGEYTVLTFKMLKNVITGKIAFNQAFGGPVKIAQYAVSSADKGPLSFLFFIAMLSLSLAIINILPFPVLDGGHLVIILIEGIFKKELPIKVKIAIQNAGFILLLLLMAFIIYSDIISM
jgi:regulator of sigma E protease